MAPIDVERAYQPATEGEITIGTVAGLRGEKNIGRLLRAFANVASSLILNEKYFGDFNYAQKEMQIYLNTTLTEAKSACREIFVKQEPVIVTIHNDFPKDQVTVINLKNNAQETK